MEDLRTYQPVRDYLLEIEVYDDLEKVADTYGVPQERVDEFLKLTDSVVKGAISLDQMQPMVMQAFGLDEAKSKALTADLLGYVLLPLENYLPEVPKMIGALGGDAKKYPTKRVGRESSSPEGIVEKFAANKGLELPEHLMKRFIYLATGYLTKERAKDATKTLLMRGSNVGGLEMTDAQADELLTELDALAANVDVKTEEVHPEVIKQARTQEQKKTETAVKPPKSDVKDAAKAFKEGGASTLNRKAALTSIPSKAEVLEHLKALEAEAPKKKAKKAKKKKEKKAKKASSVLSWQELRVQAKEDRLNRASEAANATEVAAEPAPQKKRKKKKSRGKIISKRTPVQKEAPVKLEERLPAPATEHALTTSVPVISGVDLKDDEVAEIEGHAKQLRRRGGKAKAEKFSKKVEDAVNKALQPMADIFKKKKIAKKAFSDIATTFVRGIREERQVESLLREKHGLKGKDVKSVMKALKDARSLAQDSSSGKKKKKNQEKHDIFSAEQEVLDRRHAKMTNKISDQSVEPVMPGARVSAARTKQDELAMQKGEVSDAAMKKAQAASRPKKAKAKLSAKSVVAGDGQKVTDVKFVKQLVGPVEELGTMGTADFRRLSSDPKEAVRKILDKLDLLAETRYEDRIAGVKAWRKSPMNKLYLTMAGEALKKGLSVAEVAATRRNAGEESLSPAEIQAVVELNGQIKF